MKHPDQASDRRRRNLTGLKGTKQYCRMYKDGDLIRNYYILPKRIYNCKREVNLKKKTFVK